MTDEIENDDFARLFNAARFGMDREMAEEIARAALREQSLEDHKLKEYGPWPRTTMVTEIGRAPWPNRLRWVEKRDDRDV